MGQFAMMSAYLLGAERVIGIDRIDYRLEMARDKAHAETVNTCSAAREQRPSPRPVAAFVLQDRS